MATIGGTSEYWRWNDDGSASILFEQGVATVQSVLMTLTQFDRPYADHRLLLECRTVSDVTQQVFPWVSATRRTFDVEMPFPMGAIALTLAPFLAVTEVIPGPIVMSPQVADA